jgi:hypothetical protein
LLRRVRNVLRRCASGAACACAWLAFAANARAQSTIRAPGTRPHYSFEAEPHLALAPFDPPQTGSADGIGLGFRGTFEVAPEGFIKPINDSVGIGVGLDYVHYTGNGETRGDCDRFVVGPNGVLVCTRVNMTSGPANYFFVPVTMQWNFWLHPRWSVFGEPGFALFLRDDNHIGFSPVIFYAGGRFLLSKSVTLTMRLGYPTFSFGVSFLN